MYNVDHYYDSLYEQEQARLTAAWAAECPDCRGTGKDFYCDDCGDPVNKDTDVCPHCHKDCKPCIDDCDTCDGKGEVER